MLWKGPFEDGITQSLLSAFLQCPYRFYLHVGLGKLPEVGLNQNLIWGSIFHKALEEALKKPKRIKHFTEEEFNEIEEEIKKYAKSNFESVNQTFIPSVMQMLRLYDDSFKKGEVKTEIVFKEKLHIPGEGDVYVKGKADGIMGDTLIEHKCKGRINVVQTEEEIPYDVQVNLYAYIFKSKEVIYDLIRIPDTQWSLPKKRQFQSPKDYVRTWFESADWGDFPIKKKRKLWIRQIRKPLNEETIERVFNETIIPVIRKLIRWWEHVNQPGFDPDDPKFYNEVFYKTPIRQFDPSRTEYYKSAFHDYIVGTAILEEYPDVLDLYPELNDAEV